MISPIIKELRNTLIQNIDERTTLSGQNYFKETIKLYGVKTSLVTQISKTFFKQIQDSKRALIFDLCEELWQSGYIEEAFVACNWAYSLKDTFQPDDFVIFQRWINNYVNNWASCDTLCNHTVAAFVDKYPEYLLQLKIWAESKNRWVRRAAAVTLIIPAREGRYFKDILEIANLLLLDRDDLVQKGYGWMLKAASQAYQKDVFEYVMSKKATMPRTALRYAIEKMPTVLKAKAMEK